MALATIEERDEEQAVPTERARSLPRAPLTRPLDAEKQAQLRELVATFGVLGVSRRFGCSRPVVAAGAAGDALRQGSRLVLIAGLEAEAARK